MDEFIKKYDLRAEERMKQSTKSIDYLTRVCKMFENMWMNESKRNAVTANAPDDFIDNVVVMLLLLLLLLLCL